MANTTSHSGRAGAGGGRRWRAPTRVDLLTFLVAAMLCSASYYLGIWHNSRGAADSRVLGPSASCGGYGARAAGDADEPLDFEAHHTAESAGLSVSESAPAAAARMGAGARRALRGTTGTAPTSLAVAWTGYSVPGAVAAAAAGKR